MLLDTHQMTQSEISVPSMHRIRQHAQTKCSLQVPRECHGQGSTQRQLPSATAIKARPGPWAQACLHGNINGCRTFRRTSHAGLYSMTVNSHRLVAVIPRFVRGLLDESVSLSVRQVHVRSLRIRNLGFVFSGPVSNKRYADLPFEC